MRCTTISSLASNPNITHVFQTADICCSRPNAVDHGLNGSERWDHVIFKMQPEKSESTGPAISVASTVSIILDSQPSCCEFATSSNLLVVGTYNLVPEKQKRDIQPAAEDVETPAQERTGSLLVFQITKQTASLLQKEVFSFALLDLHFSPIDPSMFAVATSVGTLCLFSIDYEHDGALTNVKTIRVWEPSTLVLSLAYQPSSESSQIAVSSSYGSIAVVSESHGEHETGGYITAHSQEAWTVAWSDKSIQHGNVSVTEHTLYSGGDDCALLEHNAKTHICEGRDGKTHGAGVTALVELPVRYEGKEVLVTGSYDEYIRVLIPPSHGRSRAIVLAEERLGGGVWRLSRPYLENFEKEEGDIEFRMLASCMHAGARVLQIRGTAETWSIEVVAKFTEHQSMNYASDFRASGEGHLFVSTSFYDRKLCVWNMTD